ncbi:DUF3772 domain-containing protein [Puniceibacterium sediminis]|uniref:Small-conductance mechanosensitive channel n=1 Tax=Puniceibacterium sediminis TaxID=1608407 RepID=A0A238YKE7_9RHOB|nr:DUF3772 domain-containing protein [Puniceibacterium sediminis]SNR71520.1 Small-conductance mechanosensitive channel [Puniceibacterium sediminis]
MALLRQLCLALTFLLITVCASLAQTEAPGALDYERWESTAVRAETALADGEASNKSLETLRTEIAGYRQRFQSAQSEQKARVATLQAQLDALGPVPEEGSREAPDIAARRKELNDQLAQQRAPVLAAEEAYTRADGMIREIDNVIRTRKAEEMLALGPSPLLPSYWSVALQDLVRSAGLLASETSAAWTKEGSGADIVAKLPTVLTLLVLTMLLTLRGPHWVHVGVNVLRRRTRRGSGVWQFVLSLGQIVLPLLGVYAFATAVRISGLVGDRVELMLERLPIWIGVALFVRWLAEQSFSRDDDVATLPIVRRRRAQARYYVTLIGLALVLKGALALLGRIDAYGPETAAVLNFPITLLCALLLFRLGQTLRDARAQGDSGGEEPQDAIYFRLRVARIVGQLILLLAIAAPVLAAIGYANLSDVLVFQTIATLLLVGTGLVIQRFIGDAFQLFTGKTVQEAQSLIPVLLGFILVLLLLPPLALIWGARVADLTEVWARFGAGFTVGGTRIAPTDFLGVILVFFAGYAVTRLIQGALRNSVLPKTRIDIGGRNAIVAGLGYTGVIGSALLAISSAGLDLTSLAFVAGGLSLGVGFGLQTIVQNFVSGIILLIERPISEGDWIQVGDQMGYVKDISVRATRIETFDRTDVIIPNADLITGNVTNYTRGNSLGRIIVSVGVAYGSDTRQVESILLGIAREHPQVMMNPAPYVYFKGFGENAMEFEIRAILVDINHVINIRTEMNHQIAERFKAAGIQIPFAQRDIWLRNPETLHSADAADRHHSALAAKPPSTPQPTQDKDAARGALHDEGDVTNDTGADAGDGDR